GKRRRDGSCWHRRTKLACLTSVCPVNFRRMTEQDEEARAMRAAQGGSEKSEYVRRTFSEIAPRYDLLNHLLSLNIDKGWRRKAIAELQLKRSPRGRYLDLC